MLDLLIKYEFIVGNRMIKSIFLIEWDKIKPKGNKTANNLNHPYNDSMNNKVDLNNGELAIDDIEIINPHIRYFYPEINGTLNNSIAVKKIINSQIIEIENFYRRGLPTGKHDLKKKSSQGKKKNSVMNNKKRKNDLKDSPITEEKIILELVQEQKQKINGGESKKQIIKIKKNMDVQLLYDFAIYSCYIQPNNIICLVFEKDDNPFDYTAEFEEILDVMIFDDLSNFNNCSDLELEIIIESIFMGIRSQFLTIMDECAFYLNEQQLREKIIHYNQNKIIKLFVFGIDNAGKSSFMRFLKTGKYDHNFFAPTKQFLIHKVSMSNDLKLVAWEMPGQKSFRRVWLRGVQDSNLLVFILDAADKKRYIEAKRALWSIITRYEVKNVPLLFIANKIDLIENESELGIIESYFSLQELKDKIWTTKFMSLVTKQGVKEVVDWISNTLNQQFMEEFKKQN